MTTPFPKNNFHSPLTHTKTSNYEPTMLNVATGIISDEFPDGQRIIN